MNEQPATAQTASEPQAETAGTLTRSSLHRANGMSVGRWHWFLGTNRRAKSTGAKPTRIPSEGQMWFSRPRRMKRSCRSILLWVLVWYVSAQLVVTCFKDRWRSIAPFNEAAKWPALHNLVVSEPERPTVLMLGSSRTCWAFRASVLEGVIGPDGQPLHCFNFGIPSTGPIHELLYLKDILAQGIRPRLLLVEFLPPLLCEPRRGVLSEESTLAVPWLSPRDFARLVPYLSRPGRRGRDWLEAQLAPCYAFRLQMHGELQHYLFGTPLHSFPAVDDWGWRIMSPKLLPAEERARHVRREHDGYSPGLGQFHMGDGPRQALHDLLTLCRMEQIQVALVLMPESSEIREIYSKQARTQTLGLLTQLSEEYGAEVINANEWIADEDFEDGHHVMAHGADVFTTRLRDEIMRLLAKSTNQVHVTAR